MLVLQPPRTEKPALILSHSHCTIRIEPAPISLLKIILIIRTYCIVICYVYASEILPL